MTINLPIQSKKENLEEDETIWCDGCLADNQKVAAIIYCQDCGENQCEECSSVHKIRRYKNHVRTDPKPKTKDIVGTEKCPIHQSCKLNRYCKNCQKLICSECSFEHSNHETISFDQPMDFYKELINKQKKFTQNHYQRINENFEQLNYSEKKIRAQKEKILKEISKFYSDQKKLFDLLEQNEKKLTNDFFEQICNVIKKEKQSINNSKSSIQKRINQFKDLEIKINESNTFQFFKLYSEMELAKTQEKLNSQFPRLCKEHKNQPYKYFCIDHQKLLCIDCAIFDHKNCQKSKNFKEGYKQIQNVLENFINILKLTNNPEKQFLEKIQNEKFNCFKEKQLNLDLIKTNYQKLNRLTQQQFKKMNEEISIQQNEKYFQLNDQFNKIKNEIDNFDKSEMIINEIEISKKYKDYQQILRNYLKLKKIISIKKEIKENNQLICSSKFNKKNIISNNLKNNLQNWKLNLPYDLNKTQINMPSEILLSNKLQVSILLKNQFDEILNAKEFNIKIEIIKKKSNEMITEITNFKKGNNQKLIGEYLFKKEGEYQILFSINDEKIPKFAFNLTVIEKKLFLKESEILQKEKNANFNEIIEKWTKEAGCNINLQRRFNSRTDGWKCHTFHQKCDQKGKSIILVKLKNKSLFGAFTAVDWDSQSGGKQSTDNKSFLFSLISLDPNFKQPLKMHIYQNKNCEIYCNSSNGPCFGNSGDLDLGYSGNLMNNNSTTRSNLGSTYKPPFDYIDRSNQSKNFLAGSYSHWDISQIEIFCEK
ncbi:hypothetical protein M0813_17728 [Anaeramoeba flamelloides]|uniref:B box-type domain-containing protein n=1 Tax=Anaeramoeba flamelloides TaxID=1746091 RepID=A0ABQ8YUT4_9EUKA|nr:hypothetical protein M0813_17728 [Anaeramoeba flamelloides]